MRKPFLALLSFLILATSFFALSTRKVHAGYDTTTLLKIYCERRMGNQLNLETWYGGRCAADDNPAESVGFGDIILLDIAERLYGEQRPNLIEDWFRENLPKIINMTSFNITSPDFGQPITYPSDTRGALSYVGTGISSLYKTPPASSLDYLASVKRNLNDKKIIPAAYAQDTTITGYGFSALTPILPIWRVFRNFAYLIFVFLFIYYGFMIMFQMKANPQTIISIQLALPKLIITLLLITFSYAIAGFLIDLFYVVLGIVFSALHIGKVIAEDPALGPRLVSGRSFGLAGSLIMTILYIPFLIPKIISGILSIPEWVADILAFFLSGFSLIIGFILMFAVFITYIKVFWMLLKSYVNIILSVIFSPLSLLGNALPGSGAFGNWVKNIFAELSVFATTIIMLLFTFYFFGPITMLGVHIADNPVGDLPTSDNAFWNAPPLYAEAPILGGNGMGNEGKFAILGLGMLLMTPKVSQMIKDSLKIKDMGYTSAIGDALQYGWYQVHNQYSGFRQSGVGGALYGMANWRGFNLGSTGRTGRVMDRLGTNPANQKPPEKGPLDSNRSSLTGR